MLPRIIKLSISNAYLPHDIVSYQLMVIGRHLSFIRVYVKFVQKGETPELIKVGSNVLVRPNSYPAGIGGPLTQKESGRGVKLTTHLHILPISRMVELYLHSAYVFIVVVLNWLSTGTTLSFACWFSGNALDLNSGGAHFEYRPGHHLSWLGMVVVFLSPSRQILGVYLDQAMADSFQVLSSPSFMYHPTIRRYRFSPVKKRR
jgi:hypothetical protein